MRWQPTTAPVANTAETGNVIMGAAPHQQILLSSKIIGSLILPK
jgi:hypothetical protein